jgi:peptide/nickel transport system permease protein/oligopeptide transport system permease protein
MELTLAAMVVATSLGLSAGVLSAVRPYSWVDGLSMLGALFGVSIPVFWQGLMLMWVFALLLQQWTGWGLPATGRGTLWHLILPAIALGTSSAAIIARMTRATMLEVLRQEYITTARAKGLPERAIVSRHALRNALIPVLTVFGLQFGALLSGAVLTETVFAWPGVGRLIVEEGILARDYPIVQGAILIVAVAFVTVNLLVDLLYGYIDPRIRYE